MEDKKDMVIDALATELLYRLGYIAPTDEEKIQLLEKICNRRKITGVIFEGVEI